MVYEKRSVSVRRRQKKEACTAFDDQTPAYSNLWLDNWVSENDPRRQEHYFRKTQRGCSAVVRFCEHADKTDKQSIKETNKQTHILLDASQQSRQMLEGLYYV